MTGSRMKLVTLFGFDVWIDASWLLLAALVAWTLADSVFPRLAPGLAAGRYWAMAAVSVIGLLCSIILHETAHSVVARHYGLPIRGITLFIFGGVADMASEPPTAKSELLMAAASPAAGLAIAAGSFLLLDAVASVGGSDGVQAIFWYLGFVNAMLAAFNLVPAFPLDGGRILRAALWMWRRDFGWATRVAAGAGDLFGLLLIVSGAFGVITGDFIGGMWRFLIGMFLRGAAAASTREAGIRAALDGVPVHRIMTPAPIAIDPGASIAELVEDYVYRYHHRCFPVVADGRLIGLVGTEQAVRIARPAWPDTAVGTAMRPCAAGETIGPDAGAFEALDRMRQSGVGRLWVLTGDRLVGVLSIRDMTELLTTKLELEHDRAASRGKRAWGGF